MPLSTNITKLRRFLRDPDGLIWSDADLLVYWNDAQVEIGLKTDILERAEAYFYPPQYTWSYNHDWETGYISGDKYQWSQMLQQTADQITHLWESAYYQDLNTAADDGDCFAHPWESAYCTPADTVPIPLNARYDKMRFAAYDNIQITPISEKELAESDRFYRSRQGLVRRYWAPDENSNQIILYPAPSSPVFQDANYTEVLDDAGGIVDSSEAWLPVTDRGVVTDVIDTADALFCVYNAIPNDIEEVTGESDFPEWLQKYVGYATLERAFGADTDGCIPSLRDYWKMRKEVGIQAIIRFKRNRMVDRDYRMGGAAVGIRDKFRLRLPDHYPATER
jgi:hypothetical protein